MGAVDMQSMCYDAYLLVNASVWATGSCERPRRAQLTALVKPSCCFVMWDEVWRF